MQSRLKLRVFIVIVPTVLALLTLAWYFSPAESAKRRDRATLNGHMLLRLSLDQYSTKYSVDSMTFPERFNEVIDAGIPQAIKSDYMQRVHLVSGMPLNPFAGRPMREVSADNPSEGDFSYIPLHVTTYRLGKPPQIETGSYVMPLYGNYPLNDGGNFGWPAWQWIASHLTGAFNDGYYDHGRRDPYFADATQGGAPRIVEWESLGSAFRRARAPRTAERIEADLPEEVGRTNFQSFLQAKWEELILQRDFDSLPLFQQLGQDINAPLSDGRPPLVHFVAALDEDGARRCLELGASAIVTDPLTGLGCLRLAQSVSQSPDPGLVSNADFVAQANRGAREAVIKLLRENGAR